MALDHTRDYFHRYSHIFDPTDLAHTTPPIFFTRWITHFCAPVFVFLAGTSAFPLGLKKTKKELSGFLLKRGLWLVLLELILVNFGWFFNPSFSLFPLQLIWGLGISMIVLSVLIYLPRKVILITCIVLVFSHILVDNIQVPGNTLAAFAWSGLQQFNLFTFNSVTIYTAYPLIPWIAVMPLGYCFGKLYEPGFDQ